MPLSLVLLAFLLLLELSLYALQERAAQADIDEGSRLAQLLATEDLGAHLTDALTRSVDTSGEVSLTNSFRYPLPGTELTLSAKWKDGESLNVAMPTGWATYETLLSQATPLASLSFDSTAGKPYKTTTVPPGHTVLALDSSEQDHGSSVSCTSQLFPYGLYAPSGSVQAVRIASYGNPVYEDLTSSSKSSDKQQIASGRPVDILAGKNIEVTTSYSSGQAIAGHGWVKLPDDKTQSGALPLSGHPINSGQAQVVFNDLKSIASNLASGCIDKTVFLDTGLFEVSSLLKLFKGDASELEALFSVGQACKVPFIPIPGMQDDLPFLVIFYVMTPFPIDFSGGTGSNDSSKQMAQIAKQIQAKQDDLTKLQGQLDAEQAKPKPDKGTVEQLQGEIAADNDAIAKLKGQAKAIAAEQDQNKKDIASNLSDAVIPTTAGEDASQTTRGWSYLYVIGDLFNIVKAILSGGNPFSSLEVRVVHLGDQDPGWSWADDSITMVANLSVPRGRTLKLTKSNVVVTGDVYLHPGAVLDVSGNLTINPPDSWNDFHGVPASEDQEVAFPNGRLIMEEGSSLIVSGDLNVNGGTYNEGSILLSCNYGPNLGLTRLIFCDGDINVKYGTAPGVEFGVLVDKLAESNPSLKGFFDDFFDPLTEEIAPQIAKLPYIGPWQWRKCWFADYCTTFEFMPLLEEFGLGGPWPIPLPFPNCLRDAFKYISIIYSTELNFFTGENLYTQSPFWIFGRGVSPVMLKVRPELVAESLGQIQWGQITWNDFKNQAVQFLTEVIPGFAEGIIEEVLAKIIESAAAEAIPFDPITCGPGTGDTPAESVADDAEKYLKEKVLAFGGQLVAALQQILVTMQNDVYSKLDGDDPQYAVLRELPGVCMASASSITLGSGGGSRFALGMFVAQGNVDIDCEYTVGSVVSVNGNIDVQELLHYPYYDRVSLYNPKKFANLVDSLVEVEDPKGSSAGDVGYPFPRRLAEGWRSL